jgi:hypothetical protein
MFPNYGGYEEVSLRRKSLPHPRHAVSAGLRLTLVGCFNELAGQKAQAS